MSEFKVDIKEMFAKVFAFDKDKFRAEKLDKKEEYLNSLCSSLLDKIAFKAIYDIVAPEDTNTSEYLQKQILKILKLSKIDIDLLGELFYVDTYEDIEEIYNKVKDKAKKYYERLKMIEINQLKEIEKNKKTRKKTESNKFESYKMPERTSNFQHNPTHQKTSSESINYKIQTSNYRTPFEYRDFENIKMPRRIGRRPNVDMAKIRKGPQKSINELREYISKNPNLKTPKVKEVGREIMDMLERDRKIRVERDKTLGQKIREGRRLDKINEEIRQRDAQRVLKKDSAPEMGMHR